MSERSQELEQGAVRDVAPSYQANAPELEQGDVPPGYKRTEVGVIPDDWNTRTVNEFGQVVTGGTPSTKVAEYWGDTYPWVTPTDISAKKDIRSTERHLSEAGFNVIRRLPANTVLVTCIASIGKNAVLRAPGGCNQQINAVIPDRSYDTDFLYYLFEFSKNSLIGSAGTTATSIISKSVFRSLSFSVPEIREQRVIATALSDADALIEFLDRLIAKKRAIKQAAMQQLLTRQTRLPGFTGEWETKRLGEYVTFLKTGTNSRAELSEGGSAAYLHYGDIHVGASVTLNPNTTTVPRIEASKVRHLDKLMPGDLVFVDASEDLEGVGKSVEIAAVPEGGMVAGLHTISARFDKAVLADGFKAYLQFCPAFIGTLRRLAAGTKVLATNRQHIASVEMKLPNVSEQEAIATVLSDMDAEIEALEHRREKARQIKQGMMQQLLTGRVRLVEETREGASYG